MKLLVLGATGYVGTRLIPAAVAAGHEVRAGARDPDDLTAFWWSDQVEPAAVDVLDPTQLAAALDGIDGVIYLVHGMGGGDGSDFARTDREAALTLRALVAEHGVQRVVYVSGIVPNVPREELSTHIRSRLEVEEILLDSLAITTVLRAAMIVGASSTSYEVLAQISRRMPVTLVPAWMDSLVEPVAICDVVGAILHALEHESASRHLDLGGGEQLAYSALLERFAVLDGLDRSRLTVPLLPKALVAEVASRIVDVPTGTVKALMESLQHDMVADAGESGLALPGARVTLDDALRRALTPQPADDPAELDPLGPMPGDPPWADADL